MQNAYIMPLTMSESIFTKRCVMTLDLVMKMKKSQGSCRPCLVENIICKKSFLLLMVLLVSEKLENNRCQAYTVD